MSLKAYNAKRDFGKTAEPSGKKETAKNSLCFVVQKHAASSLHYDLRLEMDGVLKSWAVPKGPSLNPADKRLAMMVEDHPLAYRHFEGNIPAGEYGGGTVMVWDEGTIDPKGGEALSVKKKEALLLEQLEAGKISFMVHGQKLHGEFTLVRMKGRGENTWMLIKKRDEWSNEQDVTVNATSVQSGRTMEEIRDEKRVTKAATASKKSKDERPAPASKGRIAGIDAKGPRHEIDLGPYAKLARKSSIPKEESPMLATLVDAPFDSDDWIFEIKWDGYRALAICEGEQVELVSRNRKAFTDKYRPVADKLASLGLQAVFDGEIVAVNKEGLPDFQALQNWQNTPVKLQYHAFDLVWLNGFDLTQLPLLQRKKLLQEILPDNDLVKYSDHVSGKGKAFYDVAVKKGLEGIMAKRAKSLYHWGSRTADWAKIKVAQRQEVVIAGYTEPRKSRAYFGSLLLGVYKEGKLVYAGHTGSGFTKKTLQQVYEQLQPLIQKDPAFDQAPKTNAPATWVKPALVCEIKFTEWTKEGIARHAIFQGMRQDKAPTDVVQEKSAAVKAITENSDRKTKKKNGESPVKGTAAGQMDKRPDVLFGATENEELRVGNATLSLTNLQKFYWPKEGFRKGDMLDYYRRMSPYMLPYLLERPHSLNRHPNGINAPNFFQKDMRGNLPAWMETFAEWSESTGKSVNYLVCTGEASLLYMANLGCIEINPWHARRQDYQKPDWCLIDLDPDKSNTYNQVVDVALLTKEVLDSIGAFSCVKTSGATGMHIYIPLEGKYNFEQSKQLAQGVLTIVQQEMPKLTSMERTPAKRKGKIYLDFLQNKETQTAAAPYSLRPKPGVPVSAPLHWDEVKHGLTPVTWNAFNMFERVRSEGDLFAPVLGKAIDLENVLDTLQRLID